MPTLELPLLKALNRAAANLLHEPDPQKGVSEALAMIGETADVDRVYIFQNGLETSQGDLLLSQRYEWARDSISVQIDNPELQNVPYVEAGYQRWYKELSQKQPIEGLIRDFPISERRLLTDQDILSILVLPIFVEDEFWGFVGFDDCLKERQWAVEEREVLFNLANTLGNFFLRQRYEDSLLHVKSQLEEAQRIAKVGNWRYDLLTHRLELSDEINHILGTPRGFAFTEESLGQFFDKEAKESLMGSISGLAQSVEMLDQTLPANQLSGAPIWVRLIAEAKPDAQGQRRYLQGVLMDVTHTMLMKEALIGAKERAEKADRAKSEFLSTMSHEIRTPLNAVIGYAHLLLAENPRDDQRDHLETLQFASENLLALINDILDYSKIEAGRIELETSAIELKNLLQGVVQGQRPLAEEKGLALHLHLSPALPQVIYSDSLRMGQILTNLMSNAVKFTSEGNVTLRAQWVNGTQERGTLRFEVEDTGIGIPSDLQGKIFDEFSQATSAITRQYGGTGLGLSITKKLLKLLGTGIELRSEPGQGSCFAFNLSVPVEFCQPDAAQSSSTEAPEAAVSPLAPLRFLVAEDNLVNLKVLRRFLTRWGVKSVETASNGSEAVLKAQQNRFDIILMDLHMPVMNGYDAAREIRQQDPQVPIIALTAEAMNEVKTKVKEAGMTAYASKPFNPQQLYRQICKVTSR